MEQASESFASISQETLASTEEMFHLSEEQVQIVNNTQQIAKTLTRYSQRLEKVTTEIQSKA